MADNLVNDLATSISDSLLQGGPSSAARDILEDYAVIPVSELPKVEREGDTLWINGHIFAYGMVTEQAMHQMALRGLAGLRFLELEAEARAKAEQAEKDALLTEAFTLWKSTHPEPMAQWEFEILVNDEEREKWLSIARAARSLHVK